METPFFSKWRTAGGLLKGGKQGRRAAVERGAEVKISELCNESFLISGLMGRIWGLGYEINDELNKL